MSYEVMSDKTIPCDCGGGTFQDIFEQNDWGQWRESRVIRCPVCQAAEDKRQADARERRRQRTELMDQARLLARERHLETWLSRFRGGTRKAAWEFYRGGRGYPALGTFYAHVRDGGGLDRYMEWCFFQDVARALRLMSVTDMEIADILRQFDDLADDKWP